MKARSDHFKGAGMKDLQSNLLDHNDNEDIPIGLKVEENEHENHLKQ